MVYFDFCKFFVIRVTTILGEMVNLQKVNLPKSQLAKKVNSLKTPTIAFWLFYAQVDFLASWFFGQLTFWRLTISPSIGYNYTTKTRSLKKVLWLIVLSTLIIYFKAFSTFSMWLTASFKRIYNFFIRLNMSISLQVKEREVMLS